jgi:hypothetical protein
MSQSQPPSQYRPIPMTPEAEADGPTWEELAAGALAEMSEKTASSPTGNTSLRKPIPDWYQKVYDNT